MFKERINTKFKFHNIEALLSNNDIIKKISNDDSDCQDDGTQLTKRTGTFTTWGDGDDASYDTSDGGADLRDSWTFSRGDKIVFTIRYDAGDSSNPFYDDVADSYNANATSLAFTWTLGLNWNQF